MDRKCEPQEGFVWASLEFKWCCTLGSGVLGGECVGKTIVCPRREENQEAEVISICMSFCNETGQTLLNTSHKPWGFTWDDLLCTSPGTQMLLATLYVINFCPSLGLFSLPDSDWKFSSRPWFPSMIPGCDGLEDREDSQGGVPAISSDLVFSKGRSSSFCVSSQSPAAL